MIFLLKQNKTGSDLGCSSKSPVCMLWMDNGAEKRLKSSVWRQIKTTSAHFTLAVARWASFRDCLMFCLREPQVEIQRTIQTFYKRTVSTMSRPAYPLLRLAPCSWSAVVLIRTGLRSTQSEVCAAMTNCSTASLARRRDNLIICVTEWMPVYVCACVQKYSIMFACFNVSIRFWLSACLIVQ